MSGNQSSLAEASHPARLRLIVVGAAAVVLLLSLYVGLQNFLKDQPTATDQTVFRLSIAEHADGSELPTFRAKKGAVVTFKIESAVAGEANLHGYESRVRLQPGQEGTLSVSADNEGMYPIHLHQPVDSATASGEVIHRHLAMLEILPP